MLKKLMILIPLSLTGCATTHNYYSEPNITPKASTSASISNLFWQKEKIYVCHFKSAILHSVDDQQIKYSLFTNGPARKVYLSPGKHNLAVFTDYKNGCSWVEEGGLAQFSVILTPNTNYKLNTDVKNGTIYVWLEDMNGKRISDIGSAPAINADEERYTQPLANNSQQTLIIQNYIQQSLTKYQTAIVDSIDGKEVKYDVFGTPGKHSNALMAGPHTLSIDSAFVTSTFSFPHESFGSMKINLKPGATYQLKMAPGDGYILNWIEDENGKKVTPIMKFPT